MAIAVAGTVIGCRWRPIIAAADIFEHRSTIVTMAMIAGVAIIMPVIVLIRPRFGARLLDPPAKLLAVHPARPGDPARLRFYPAGRSMMGLFD